ncbi:MAG: CPBP family intramembrane glutamic endopeptidase, partial [Planctomycetota bacterium]
ALLMQASRMQIVPLATKFYAAVVLIAWAWSAFWDTTLFGVRNPSSSHLLEGLWTGLGIVVFCHIANALFAGVRRASKKMGEMLGAITPLQAVYLAAISGFAEELLFRGALWDQLGLIGTSIFFGLCHVVPVRGLAGYPIFAFFAGLILGALREHSGSIWPAVVAHFAVNALNLAWIGREAAKRLPPRPDTTEVGEEPERPELSDLTLPAEIGIPDTFPITIWRYDLRVELTGTDRQTLPQCLEHENLSIFRYVARPAVYEELENGRFVFTQSFDAPLVPFPNDVATISSYLFEPVTGVEVAERFVDDTATDDVRAWKIVAQRGQWVKVPLVVEQTEPGKFLVDPDREDEDVLAAQWQTFPRWFQDGMRFRYPRLRDL